MFKDRLKNYRESYAKLMQDNNEIISRKDHLIDELITNSSSLVSLESDIKDTITELYTTREHIENALTNNKNTISKLEEI